MCVATEISVLRGTLRHEITRDLLDLVRSDGDHDIFTDKGDIALLTLYDDTIAANIKKINKEESRHLKY